MSHVEAVESERHDGGQSIAAWAPDTTVDAQLQAMLSATSGPTNWRLVPAAEAEGRWQALRDWVDWFRDQFALDHRAVPPCWYRHTALVELLSALHDHWLFAYDPMNTAVAASEWHRSLIVLEQRLRDWSARTGCTAAMHRSDVRAVRLEDAAEWDAHVRADVATRIAPPATGPRATDEVDRMTCNEAPRR